MVFTNLGRIHTFAVKVIGDPVRIDLIIPNKWDEINKPPSADHEELRENLTH
jgi:hypothetical protein